MFGITSHNTQRTCGLIIDIGSGSVGAAIVVSDSNKKNPEIIWSSREYCLIKEIDTLDIPLKEISTSLVNIFLKIGNDGAKAIKATKTTPPITQVHTSISAPWTYTVTKTINFTDEHPFEVDQKLIQQLSETAEKQAFSTVLENKMFQASQLEVIDNDTVGVTINGYPIINPDNIKTREVSLAHITAITQTKILSVLEDSLNKVLPKADGQTHSFMYTYYDTLRHMNPDTSEACLIDITSEATEIGIIREGVLTHVTHIAFGTFSIAREIAALCNIPQEEAYIYIKGGRNFVETKLTEAKKAELQVILDAYEEKVTQLFTHTGDSLAIPKTLFIHCDSETEEFYISQIEKAAYKTTGIKHTAHPVTSMLFKEAETKDTALLLSAYRFHRNNSALGDTYT
jgi:hypothetical protein